MRLVRPLAVAMLLSFAAVMQSVGAGAADVDPSNMLVVSVVDAAGDSTGPVDVLSLRLEFDRATGDYEIRFQVHPEAPFRSEFRVNINLFNVDDGSFFQDVFNDFDLSEPTTTLSLTGTSSELINWEPGDRVYTNSLAGTPNPPETTLFRTSVSGFPHSFRTNEDTIAFLTLSQPGVVQLATDEPSEPVFIISADTELTSDLNSAVTIVTDDVSLDCVGHKVTGAGTGVVGIDIVQRSRVVVHDCDVSRSEIGIRLDRSVGSVIESNHVHDNPGGISITESADNEIRGNLVTGNGYGILMGLWGGGGNTVDANTVTGNTSSGISLDHASGGNVISNNRLVGNGSSGLYLWEADGNTITGNLAEGNDSSGFTAGRSSGNAFIDNEAHNNLGVGFSDSGSRFGVSSTYTLNYCTGNEGGGSSPAGLCQEEMVGLVDPSQGMWHLRHSENAGKSFFYGNPGDVPFLGDWNCDGETTPGLFRQSDAFAYLRNSNSQGIADIRFFFGNPSDVPLAGDFNGNGCDTLSIYRPSEAKFYIMNELGENEGGLGAADYSFLFGNMGDKPVVGDWDGDGVDEIGLHRESTGFFYYRNTLTTGVADGQFFFGDPGDRFVAGDWGVVDGVDTPAMFRPSNATFYFRHTLTQGAADSQFKWDGAGTNWLPVAGDFTAD